MGRSMRLVSAVGVNTSEARSDRRSLTGSVTTSGSQRRAPSLSMALVAVGERDGVGLVGGFVLNLLDVPGRVEEREVDYAHVGAHALHVLQVPQRIGVVVAVGEEDGVGGEAFEQVVGVVARDVVARAVVVVVVLAQHASGHGGEREGRHAQHGEHEGARREAVAQAVVGQLHEAACAQAHPQAEGEEAAHVGIVALARLHGRLVQVHDDAEARHQKEDAHAEGAPPVLRKVEEGAEEA